ncbi:ribonuclease III [Candidatus Saccharibacteria bacterium]|nr:ribonuclease III [Candidatus Saccharibacteria bacterium]
MIDKLKQDLHGLFADFGIKINNPDLIIRAFIHRSYLNENRGIDSEHNERLEFLGDAVLELVVTEYLYRKFSRDEGVLTNLRSALVKTETLSETVKDLGFSDYLLVSRGELKSGGRERTSLQANLYEAIVGAIYLDQGIDKAREFITTTLLSKLDQILSTKAYLDPKSHFQELSQQYFNITPTYQVLDESGPDHDKLFTVGIFVGDQKFGVGEGTSKQSAQQTAAEDGLKNLPKHKQSFKL